MIPGYMVIGTQNQLSKCFKTPITIGDHRVVGVRSQSRNLKTHVYGAAHKVMRIYLINETEMALIVVSLPSLTSQMYI